MIRRPFDAGHGRPLQPAIARMQRNVRVWRDDEGAVRASVPHSVVWHSPTGFECGYAGSGPADLALNILNAFVPPGADGEPAEKCFRGRCSRFAARHHQAFKFEFIADMPRVGGTISYRDILRFIEERTGAQGGAS